MKGILSKGVFEEIYKMLNSVNHVDYDCGNLCEKSCCQKTDPEMGIYLMPNEHLVLKEEKDWLIWAKHPTKNYDFPHSWKGDTYFISCNGNCPREKRPLQCRTFPLAPHLDQGDSLFLIWETIELPYSCPLLKEKKLLNSDFIQTLYRTWKILIKDPLIRDLVFYDSTNRINDGAKIEIVYPKK